VFCEDDVDRKVVIEQCISSYKRIAAAMEDNYLDCMNNDIVKSIGYKTEMFERVDLEGVNLWNELHHRMNEGTLSEENIVQLLEELPLCFLLSFSGYASFKEKTVLEVSSSMEVS